MGMPTYETQSQRYLWVGIGFSVVFHALLFTLHFKFPDASRAFQEKALEIILVNSRSAQKPSKAQALAQTNLNAGGNVEEDRRAKTPLPPSRHQQTGDDLEQAKKRIQALEARQKHLLAESRSKRTIAPVDASVDTPPQPEPETTISGRDLANRALAMARLEGEIARDIDEYNKRPRLKHIGTSTEEYRFARYIEDWRSKVERIGTLNYPEAARGKLFGSLIISVTIRSNGTVDKIVIDRSSGHRILDEAAKRIVTMAAPYAEFPPDIRRDWDIIEITRTMTFTSSNALETTGKR